VALQSVLKSYAGSVDARLETLLPAANRPPAELHEAMRYSCLAPGKRLRPVLCLASCVAVGGNLPDALDAACAIEMVHCFSLIHDDLPALDDDDLRRGVATCHVKFGEATAILAGDALFSLAFETLASLSRPPEQVVQAIRSLTRATGSDGLVAGEAMDLLSEGKPVELETLAAIHRMKTGALIAGSCEIGAIFGGGTSDQISALGEYGQQIGLAFQIADDLLNETSTPEQLGKAAGSDRERQKMTYPALFGIEGSRSAALSAAERGIECLKNVDDSEGFLEALARFSVERLS
jgi:geranylgeranyl diphosphate synthase type II